VGTSTFSGGSTNADRLLSNLILDRFQFQSIAMANILPHGAFRSVGVAGNDTRTHNSLKELEKMTETT
jgi:hypothetical protein